MTTMQPPPAPAARTRPPGPRLLISLVLTGLGAIIGIVSFVVIALALATSSLTSTAYTVPGTLSVHLHDARYTVYQYVGSRSLFGSDTTPAGVVRIPPSALTVTAPDGSTVPITIPTNEDEITRGTSVYRGALQFDTPSSGDYILVFSNTIPARVIVARSIGDALRGVAVWFGVGALGGMLLIVGIVMLIVGMVRRGRAKRMVYAGWGPQPQWGGPQPQWGAPPPPQWGPPPQQQQPQWGPPPQQQQWTPPGQWTPPTGGPPPPPAQQQQPPPPPPPPPEQPPNG